MKPYTVLIEGANSPDRYRIEPPDLPLLRGRA
jgi:hypothetical protein